ncbi:MAG TPA: LysM peptidoglycan-binding domain-containing protein [Longimicrobium sp.]|nr:LysM peptidoglycan-binding domain-containing protein [Longimicrobium sp.]
MRRAAYLVAAAGLAAAAPLAAQQEGAQQQQRVHVVQRGETLWDIARTYLSDPFLWPEIFRLNTDVVEDPARIYPSERLVLPPGVAGAAPQQEGRTVFYRGEQSQQRDDRIVLPLGTAEFPVVRQGDFYRAAFVARPDEVRPNGRVAEVISPTVVPLTRTPMIRLYDRVFVALSGAAPRIGDRLQFIRPGRELRPHGRVYEVTGLGTVAAVEDQVATVVVVGMFDMVEPGNLTVPADRFPVRPGAMPVAAQGPQGTILAFENPHPAQSTEEVAFLDLGRQAGVREGDVFEVFLPRAARDWGTRPEIPVARLQVVKVTDATASARITNLSQPAVAVGLPVRRVARMPDAAR